MYHGEAPLKKEPQIWQMANYVCLKIEWNCPNVDPNSCQSESSLNKYAVHKVEINSPYQNEDNRFNGKALIYGQDKI